MGIVFHFVDTQDPSLVEAAISDKTKLGGSKAQRTR